MKILHICQQDTPDSGGSLRVAESLVLEQRRMGLDAWVLFLYGPSGEVCEELGTGTICLGLKSSHEAGRGILQLFKETRKLRPDVIHSHDGIIWPRLALLWLRIPVVMHSHLPASASASWASKVLIRWTTDIVLGISQHTIRSWGKVGFPASKIHYVPNGVDFNRFSAVSEAEKRDLRIQLNLPVDKQIVLWVGRLHAATKGTNRVEHFASIMPDNMIVVVVGNGPSRDEMHHQCRKHIQAGRVIMAGSISTPGMYYKAADLFLFTSYQEAFGLVILEAVASHLPIVAFPLLKGGGAADLLEEVHANYIFDTSSAEEVRALLVDERLQSNCVKATLEKIKNKYSWDTQCKEVQYVYKTLLNLGPSVLIDQGKPRVIVCQHGARHRYAIPRMLNEAGMLSAFYTDSSGESQLGKCVKYLGKRIPEAWQDFARWNIQGVPKSKTYSSDRAFFVELGQRLTRTSKSGMSLFYQRHRILSSRMQCWGLQEANIIYSMYHENLDFIRWAKDRGALSAIDVFISPITDEIMRRENKEFPDWAEPIDEEGIRFEQNVWNSTVALADLLICPSEWVAEGVRQATPSAANRIRIVPYGCSMDYEGKKNVPVKGRILFAGGDPLRKGLHYLAQAASQLKDDMPDLDVRIAGNLADHIVNHPIAKDLNFLGKLNQQEMKSEYLSADALVLPALSEGFAGVVAEAIGAGCPVIVTLEAGSPVVHEREGLIIPSRDIDALASAIQRMVTDRALRQSCSDECLRQVPFYSESSWQSRLVKVLQECVNK